MCNFATFTTFYALWNEERTTLTRAFVFSDEKERERERGVLSCKARGFFLPFSFVVVKTVFEKLNWWNTTNALRISKGGNLWFIASTLLFFLSRVQKYYQRERRETKRRTDLRNVTVVFFLFIHQTRANHRRHKFIGKAESLFRWNLQFICV